MIFSKFSKSHQKFETKATLAESDGAFAFSSGDAIKIFNGTGTYSGTTTSTSGSGSFTMEDGFTDAGSGYAGFPASMVSSIDENGVKFNLPDSYAFDEVGSTDANAAKVPCPMVGTYTACSSISLKQVGAVIRFRITNVAAGSLIFTFPTNVTGTLTNSIQTPSGTSDGILVGNLTSAGKVISVSDVPAVSSGYIYVTLPVPTETVPQNIIVSNIPAAGGDKLSAIFKGSSTNLLRAGGLKVGAQLAEPTSISGNHTAQDGETLTGELVGDYKISIADGATIVLDNVTISGANKSSCKWAGITCEGNATIILRGRRKGGEVEPLRNQEEKGLFV